MIAYRQNRPGLPRRAQVKIDPSFLGFVGKSEALRFVLKQVEKVAVTEANVLILGENGTGKELVARALHALSPRRRSDFYSVDMGALTETLFESELFGHKKGAFTDAHEHRTGKFEAAGGGTLFLDEIGNLPLSLQAKLLTVLQQRQIMKIGSNERVSIDVRLICATNQPVHQAVAEKRFRPDLLYRINTVELVLPPLRERVEDIGMLANHYRDQFASKYNPLVASISEKAVQKLESYEWPGNVRELMHMLERAVIMTESGTIQPEDIQFSRSSESDIHVLLTTLNLDSVEKQVIDAALSKHFGNVSGAASELGLTRATLYRRLKKHEL